jgi:hypothetical protein
MATCGGYVGDRRGEIVATGRSLAVTVFGCT